MSIERVDLNGNMACFMVIRVDLTKGLSAMFEKRGDSSLNIGSACKMQSSFHIGWCIQWNLISLSPVKPETPSSIWALLECLLVDTIKNIALYPVFEIYKPNKTVRHKCCLPIFKFSCPQSDIINIEKLQQKIQETNHLLILLKYGNN